jgi:hypothetical protein
MLHVTGPEERDVNLHPENVKSAETGPLIYVTNFRVTLPTAISVHLWAATVYMMSEPTRSDRRYWPYKIMTVHLNFSQYLNAIRIHKTVISLSFCTGMKLGITLSEEHRVRVFENGLLRRMFGESNGKLEKNSYCVALWFVLVEYHYRSQSKEEVWHMACTGQKCIRSFDWEIGKQEIDWKT